MKLNHILRWVEQQESQAEFIFTAVQNLLKADTNNITRERIETRLEALHNHWQTYSLHDGAINAAILELSPEDRNTVKQHYYFKEKRCLAVNEIYLDSVEVMKLLLSSHRDPSHQRSTTPSIDHSNVSISVHNPRLPRIDLPKFDGVLDNWLSFRDLFSSLVIDNNSISPVEKLQYLKTSLIGAAAHLLKNTTLTEENFDHAWKDVTSFYENERLLINSSMQTLFSIKRMTKESATEMEHLYTSMMQVYRNLDTLHRPVRHWDDILVFMAVQRLDSESVKAWERHLGPSKAPPTWDQFKNFLLGQMLSLRAFERSEASAHHHSSRYSSNRTHLINAPDQIKISCPLCAEYHYLGRCRKFQTKTVEQRRHFITTYHLCFNCLGPHRTLDCRSTSRCLRCGKRHHTSIHHDEPPKQPSQSGTGDMTTSQTSNHAA